ncbi:MAG: DUF58 domain-containing protein [Treponema sp.]|nr:DUF58 domain-containing protein [Treponema sp.]
MKMFPSSRNTVFISGKKLLISGVSVFTAVFLFSSLAFIQFFCLFFLFIIIGSRLYSEYIIRNINIIRCDEELRVFRHEWLNVDIRIENKSLLPAFMLVINDSPGPIAVFRDNKILRSLFKRSWTLMKWQGYCGDRGVFNIGPVTVRGSDPLGLFPFQLTSGGTSRVFVYPVFRSIAIKPPGGIPLGNMLTSNRLFEDITRRRSLRPYQSGDELRRINWKVSARMSQFHVTAQSQSGGLVINEYEATVSCPLMIFLSLNKGEYPARKHGAYMERAIEAAAALCLKASVEKQEVGIIFYLSCHEKGLSVIPPSAFTLVHILERLAAVDLSADWDAVQPVSDGVRAGAMIMLEQGKYLSYGTRYVYIGPDLGDEAYISLNSLKRHHLSLEYLIIDERSVPSLAPGNSRRYQIKEQGFEIV